MELGPDGKYEHPFIGINDELCKICMQQKHFHHEENPDLEDPENLVENIDENVDEQVDGPNLFMNKLPSSLD